MGNCLNTSRTTTHQSDMYSHSAQEASHQPLDPTHPIYHEYVQPVQNLLNNIEQIRGRMHAMTHSRPGEPPFDTAEFNDVREELRHVLNDSRRVRSQAQQIVNQLLSGERSPVDTRSGTPLQVYHRLSEFHEQVVRLGRRYNNEILHSVSGTAAALPAANTTAPQFFRQDSNISEFGIPTVFLPEGR